MYHYSIIKSLSCPGLKLLIVYVIFQKCSPYLKTYEHLDIRIK